MQLSAPSAPCQGSIFLPGFVEAVMAGETGDERGLWVTIVPRSTGGKSFVQRALTTYPRIARTFLVGWERDRAHGGAPKQSSGLFSDPGRRDAREPNSCMRCRFSAGVDRTRDSRHELAGGTNREPSGCGSRIGFERSPGRADGGILIRTLCLSTRDVGSGPSLTATATGGDARA